MNKENAKDYLPLVQALADGKTIQSIHNGEWFDLPNPSFNGAANLYRIKPEPKKGWYRVALFKNGVTCTEFEEEEEKCEKHNSYFIRWLTDRIEYTLPEGDV